MALASGSFFESRLKTIVALLLPAAILYFKSIWFDFTMMDEQWMIVKNADLLHGSQAFKDAFTKGVAGLYYRPLLLVSFFYDYAIGRLSPPAYHLTNLVLHLLAVYLLYRFLCLNTVPQKTAFFAALIFSVHPVLIHAVAWVPGRNDILLCVFTLLSLNSLVRYLHYARPQQGIAHVLFFMAALLTKESAVLLPLMFAAFYGYYKRSTDKKFIYFILAWLVLAVGLVVVRGAVTGQSLAPGSLISMAMIKNSVPAMLLYLGKAFYPLQLSVMPTLAQASLIPGILALATLLFLLFKRGVADKKMAGLGLLLFFTMLIIPVLFSATEHYEHRIYTSMVGLLLFFTQLRFNYSSAYFKYALGIIFCLLFFKAWWRLPVYKGKESFLTAGANECPSFYLFQFQKGELLFERASYDSAIIYCDRAIAIRPDKYEIYSNRGTSYYYLGRFKEAVQDFTKAIELCKTFEYKFNLNRCYAYKELGETEKAMKDLFMVKKCCQNRVPATIEKEVIDSWIAKLDSIGLQLTTEPNNPVLYYRRARMLFDIERNEDAMNDLARACTLAPDNKEYLSLYMQHQEQDSTAKNPPVP